MKKKKTLTIDLYCTTALISGNCGNTITIDLTTNESLFNHTYRIINTCENTLIWKWIVGIENMYCIQDINTKEYGILMFCVHLANNVPNSTGTTYIKKKSNTLVEFNKENIIETYIIKLDHLYYPIFENKEQFSYYFFYGNYYSNIFVLSSFSQTYNAFHLPEIQFNSPNRFELEKVYFNKETQNYTKRLHLGYYKPLKEKEYFIEQKYYINKYAFPGNIVYNIENTKYDIIMNNFRNYITLFYTNYKNKEQYLYNNYINKQDEILNQLDKIYKGERCFIIMLFEVLFGYFITEEQYILYNKIISEPKNVYQMLMGQGKTSVIMPLLLLHSILIDKKSFILCLPKHLITQSFVHIRKTLLDILPIDLIQIDTNMMSQVCKHTYQCIIIDDTTMKLFLLKKDFDLYNIKKNIDLFNICYDEFDYMYNPSTSFLNVPIEYKTNDISFEIIMNTMFNYIDKKYIIIEKNNQLKFNNPVPGPVPGPVHVEITLEEKINNILTNNIFPQIENMTYLKDYGLVESDFIAIPFEFLNKPLINSKFSDIGLSICLTILCYYFNGLRYKDILLLFDKIKSSSNEIKKSYIILFKEIGIDITNEIDKIEPIKEYNLSHEIKNKSNEIIRRICKTLQNYKNTNNDDDKKKKINAEKIIRNYIKWIILPKFTISLSKQTISFIDIFLRFEYNTIYAFTGTPTIRLLKEMPINGIKENKDASEKIKLVIQSSEIILLENTNNIFVQLENYNCFIDAGAFIKDYSSSLEFIKEQVQHLKNDISERDVMFNVREKIFNEAEQKQNIEQLISILRIKAVAIKMK